MRVLITGVSGFVGGHMVDLIRAEHPSAEVFGLDSRPGTRARALGIEVVKADLAEAASVRHALESVRPDRVVHLAAQSSPQRSWADPAGTLKTNLLGLLHLLEAARALALEPRVGNPGGGDYGIKIIGLGLAGRRDEARAVLSTMNLMARIPTFHVWTSYLHAWLERRIPDMLEVRKALSSLKVMDDPEAIFQEGLLLCDVGEFGVGLDHVRRAFNKGYYVAAVLEGRPQFDAIRDQAAFQAVLATAREGRDAALAAFREAGGERLLGRR